VPESRPGPRWPILPVRAIAVLLLVQVLLQAALAGGFVSGKVTLLGLHSANGILLVLSTAALLPAAVLLRWPGRGPGWPILYSAVLGLLVLVQTGIGFARLVGWHIPLGLVIFGLVSAFTWWACAHRPARVAP
jgi:hypothetical protein